MYHSQVPNNGSYLPQQSAPHISPQSSAPPVRRSTRPHAPAPASALTQSYSSSPLHSSGTVPQPPSFPIPAVPGGYGVPSHPSGLVPPPSLPMTERTTTSYAHNVQVGYQNVPAPGIPHQPSMGWSHQDVGSSTYGNQGFEQSPDMTGNMNNYAKERGRTSLPFAGGGHRQRTNRAEEQVPQPNLPCISCRRETPPGEHARLGGFCSERHRWEWDSNQNQNQSRRMP